MGYASSNGIRLYYEIYGEGYPILFVHGFGGCRLEWFVQVKIISKKFKAVIFDNRGAGKSYRPNYPYTMDMFVDDIIGLMDYLKIEKAHICGASLGGMIVQNFAIKYPNRVNKLVLINTFPGFPNQQGIEMYKKGLINRYYRKLKDPAKSFFDSANTGYTRKFIKQMRENPKKKFFDLFSAEDIIKNDITDITTPQDIENSASAIAGHEVRDRLSEVKNKTLILCAEKDKLSPVSINEQIHKLIPNSEFKVIKDAGHNSKLEKALETNQAILDFLSN